MKITLEQLGDALNDYRTEVRHAVARGHPRSVTEINIELARDKLRYKLTPFGIAKLINWDTPL